MSTLHPETPILTAGQMFKLVGSDTQLDSAWNPIYIEGVQSLLLDARSISAKRPCDGPFVGVLAISL